VSDRFEDHRGVIQDVFGAGTLAGKIDAVTRITTLAGHVRGNHVHHETTQWTLVLSVSLVMASGDSRALMKRGEIVKHAPGVPHAWRAVSDCECLVFTRGPRSGADYESDTHRLEEPLL
jgi:quercetin dioxygenase-like cupin family protein